MTVKQRLGMWGVIVLVGLTLIGGQLLTAQAGVLPPRPTLTPAPHGSPGARIELRLPTDNLNLWTVVQWQDRAGNWHEVEGWRGVLDSLNNHTGDKTWWVLSYSYGAGPMRWLVYDRAGGQLLATSQSFSLPEANQHVIVEVKLK